MFLSPVLVVAEPVRMDPTPGAKTQPFGDAVCAPDVVAVTDLNWLAEAGTSPDARTSPETGTSPEARTSPEAGTDPEAGTGPEAGPIQEILARLAFSSPAAETAPAIAR